jgi:superoxide dismutase, Fe-Mn family
MTHHLLKLPYSLDALEPHISAETLDFHYNKHHKGYVDKLNELIARTEFEECPLEETILRASGAIFNNAAQVWNHSFYWNCMKAKGGGSPKASFQRVIDSQFGSLDKFINEFTEVATGRFGSGYAWLVKNPDGSLSVEATPNAQNPMTHGKMPLLTADVWEHAYYIDYRNDREQYLESFWKVINWDFVEHNLFSAPREIPTIKENRTGTPFLQ